MANNWIWPLKVSHIVPQLSDSDRSQLNYNWIITESRQNDVGVVSHNYCGKTNSPIKIKHMWEHLWYLNLYSSALGNLYCSYFSKKAKKTLSFLEGCPTIDELTYFLKNNKKHNHISSFTLDNNWIPIKMHFLSLC